MKVAGLVHRGSRCVVLACLLAACRDGDGGTDTRTPLVVQADRPTVEVGRTAQLTVAPGATGAAPEVAWSSSDTTRAKVTADGVVTTFAPGEVLLTARSNGSSGATSLRIVPAADAGSFVAVSAGGRHACALDTGGRAYCWGSEYQPGGATPPTPVPGGRTFRSISTGSILTCGVATTGEAYCWGNESSNFYGQHGNGSLTFLVSTSGPGVPVVGGLTFASVAAGVTHACGITTAGDAYCWGRGDSGELGTAAPVPVCYQFRSGESRCSPTPLPVAGGLKFRSISVMSSHSCGVTTGGDAYCWGTSDYGLGNGSVTRSTTPVRVDASVRFESVTAGVTQSCALTPERAAYCWGYGLRDANTAFVSRTPQPAAEGLGFSSIDTGFYHVCGVGTTGLAHCWLTNVYGALGTGSTTAEPRPARVAGGLTFLSVSAGAYFSCGVTSSHAVYCWGLNDARQLGTTAPVGSCPAIDRTVPCSTVPVPVQLSQAQAAREDRGD